MGTVVCVLQEPHSDSKGTDLYPELQELALVRSIVCVYCTYEPFRSNFCGVQVDRRDASNAKYNVC